MPWLLSRPIVILAALAAILGAANLWQLWRAGKASEACKTRLAQAQAEYLKLSLDRDTTSVSISRETVAEAEADVSAQRVENDQRIEHVRTIIRTVPIPANCPTALPDGVQDNLRDAAAAANR